VSQRAQFISREATYVASSLIATEKTAPGNWLGEMRKKEKGFLLLFSGFYEIEYCDHYQNEAHNALDIVGRKQLAGFQVVWTASPNKIAPKNMTNIPATRLSIFIDSVFRRFSL